MTTSTAPPTPATHQKIGALAPALTAARTAHGLGDLALFDVDGVVIAFAGGDAEAVDLRVQARAEGLAAVGQRCLSFSRGIDRIKRAASPTLVASGADQAAELITLKYRMPAAPGSDGEVLEWPMAVYSVAGTLGLIGNVAPSQVSYTAAVKRLGYALAKLADELGGRVELRPLVATA